MAQHKFKCQQMTLKWNPNNSVLKIVSDCTGTCQNTNWWSNQVEPASQILWAVSLLLHHHLSALIFLVCWLSVILFNVKTWKFQWGGVLDIYLFKGSQKCRELGLCGHVMVEENKSCFAFAQNGDVYPIVPNAEIEKSSKCLIVLKVIASLIITDIFKWHPHHLHVGVPGVCCWIQSVSLEVAGSDPSWRATAPRLKVWSFTHSPRTWVHWN